MLIIMLLGIVSCDNNDEPKPSGQVVAKVDGNEITIHQLQYEVGQHNLGQVVDMAEASKKILENMIDRQLFAQKAIEMKLHRTADVLREMESSKSKILAKAYLQRLSSTLDKPTDAEIKKFYEENPERFTNRRIFKFEQLSAKSDKDIPGLEDKIKSAADLKELAEWFKESKIEHRLETKVQPAEKLPKDIVKRMLAMENGQGALIKTRAGYIIIRLLAFKEEPITQDKAGTWISAALTRQKMNELSKSEIDQLRSLSKITYEGIYKVDVAKAEEGTPKAEEGAPKAEK